MGRLWRLVIPPPFCLFRRCLPDSIYIHRLHGCLELRELEASIRGEITLIKPIVKPMHAVFLSWITAGSGIV